MKIIRYLVTCWFMGAVLFLLSAGCSNDSTGGGAAAEEAILEAGIVSPSTDITIEAGQSVEFHGFASNGDEPYAFLWDFDGVRSASDQKDPGFVIFENEGVYTVTFAAIDANGVQLGNGTFTNSSTPVRVQ